uniref:Uncharacterized protein n=1 Tax=Magnetococcus massalia (strain MO-1) TaxID=451514 RepID=A0A1S7LGX7_MAGMO|nr:conserved protein of unknown function [Candidatus Magnetococcus massalia]
MHAHPEAPPKELINNHYLLGTIRGMMSVLMKRCQILEEQERGHALIEVSARLLKQDAHLIGTKLAALHEAKSDLDYLEGVNDGTDRLASPSEGRRQEVIYRLIHRLKPYC